MKILHIVFIGALLFTALPASTTSAQQPDVNSDLFDITLESGEIFTIPVPFSEFIESIDEASPPIEEKQVSIAQKDTLRPEIQQQETVVNKEKTVKEDGKHKKKKRGLNPNQKISNAHLVAKDRIVVVTAYSSTVDQTDASPCITANGFNVCEHNKENIIAANFLPFGTRVRLPDISGEKIFTVQDRMHYRHSSRVDIWMKTRSKAKQFGVKRSTIEIVSEHVALKP